MPWWNLVPLDPPWSPLIPLDPPWSPLVPLWTKLNYTTVKLKNLRSCFEVKQCIDDYKWKNKNQHPQHNLPQTYRGIKSVCLVCICTTDHFLTYLRTSFRINEHWYNKYDTQAPKIPINETIIITVRWLNLIRMNKIHNFERWKSSGNFTKTYNTSKLLNEWFPKRHSRRQNSDERMKNKRIIYRGKTVTHQNTD